MLYEKYGGYGLVSHSLSLVESGPFTEDLTPGGLAWPSWLILVMINGTATCWQFKGSLPTLGTEMTFWLSLLDDRNGQERH